MWQGSGVTASEAGDAQGLVDVVHRPRASGTAVLARRRQIAATAGVGYDVHDSGAVVDPAAARVAVRCEECERPATPVRPGIGAGCAGRTAGAGSGVRRGAGRA